jgi:hypothetical protein
MNQNNSLPGTDRHRIVRATLWALLAGVLIVVGVILPAEYGVDLTGFGRLTGLTAMARAKQADGEPAAAPAAAAPLAADASGKAPPLTVWAVAHPEKYRSETVELTLKGDEEAEYKAVVARGESLLYTWRVKEGSQVYFEFHGQPSEGTWPKDYYESYEKGESTGGQGAMVSPFTGEHGWYWLNLSEKPVTIVVELAGYYSKFGRYGEEEGG